MLVCEKLWKEKYNIFEKQWNFWCLEYISFYFLFRYFVWYLIVWGTLPRQSFDLAKSYPIAPPDLKLDLWDPP